MLNGIGTESTKATNISKHFTTKITEAIFNTSNLNHSSRQGMFDPKQWADVFKRSGAKYVVLTSNIMKDIVYGTALKQTAIGDVHGMQ
jgi:hypothetical protein